MRRCNQRESERFRDWVGRVYEDLERALAHRPTDEQPAHTAIVGATRATASEIEKLATDVIDLWELTDVVEEWEQRNWRVLDLVDPFQEASDRPKLEAASETEPT